MAGIHRSGSTLLSAILNQHPEIYSSPQTELISMLYELNDKIPTYQSYKAGLFHTGYENIMRKTAETFYSHIEKSVIIDKNTGWGTPHNWDILSPYVNPEGKVIVTLRPILEVLASLVKVLRESQKITGHMQYPHPDLWVYSYRTKTDALVDDLMMPNGEIDRAILSISNLLKNHGDRVLVVWFDDLLESPENTMNTICDFLGLDRHEFSFDSIEKSDKHDDLNGYGVLGLHDVGKKLKAHKIVVEDYLSEYTIAKYAKAMDFLWS